MENLMYVVREVARILKYKSVPNADKGGGGQKIQTFCDIFNGCPLATMNNQDE